MQNVSLRGVRLSDTTMTEAVAFLKQRLTNGEQTAVFTPNAEIMQEAMRDASFRDVLNTAELTLADGAGVLRAARMLGIPLREKIAGVDFGRRFLAETAPAPVFLLGGRPGVAEAAAHRLTTLIPGLCIVGTADGYFGKTGAENDAITERIRRSGASVLLVCFGAPAQERWVAANRGSLPGVSVFLALGGSIDVYAGTERRAPAFLIRHRLEWLWRLCRHPSRFRRMCRIPRFLLETRRVAAASHKKNR